MLHSFTSSSHSFQVSSSMNWSDAHQDENLRRTPQRGGEMAHRVDGVGTAGAADLGIGDHEVAIALGRQAHHLQPMLGGRQIAFGLVRR